MKNDGNRQLDEHQQKRFLGEPGTGKVKSIRSSFTAFRGRFNSLR